MSDTKTQLPKSIVEMIDNMVEFSPTVWREFDCNTWIHPPVRNPGEYAGFPKGTEMQADQIKYFIRLACVAAIEAATQDARERAAKEKA